LLARYWHFYYLNRQDAEYAKKYWGTAKAPRTPRKPLLMKNPKRSCAGIYTCNRLNTYRQKQHICFLGVLGVLGVLAVQYLF
jgi:hypothetical protein